LGRLVDLDTFQVLRTLADVPDEELTDLAAGIATLIPRSGDVTAFDLSDGTTRWYRATTAPCRHLVSTLRGAMSGCGDRVIRFGRADGAETIVDRGPHASDPIVVGSTIVSPHEDGRINVYDADTGRLRASRVIPELARAYQSWTFGDGAGEGVCVLGLAGTTYSAGCYDRTLRRRWASRLPVPKRGAEPYDVRQLGPRLLVLDDQSSPNGRFDAPSVGAGVVLSWADGRSTPFSDGTFATIEDRSARRLRPDPDPFTNARLLPPSGDFRDTRDALIVEDESRAFALIANGATALAGVDRSSGRTLFLVPVPVGRLWKLELANGMPVVRTRFDDHWVVTVHDRKTGTVLYRDARPLARSRE
jgi:hypothetical protein